jgi:quinol monooxygenase YgiN
MPTLAAQITIGDYAKWRPVFDKNKALRDKAGLTNVRVYRDADNPKELIIWSETADAAKAREALGSSEVRSAMQEAGVVGPPKIHMIAQKAHRD